MFLKSRKILSILIAGILSLSLAACGGKNESAAPGSSAGAGDAGSVSTPAAAEAAGNDTESAEAAGNDTESTGAPAVAETNEEGKGADSVQDSSVQPAYKTADYIQDEIVIADTDRYKLTVTGFDPDYANGGTEGFLVHMKMENKTEKEYEYMTIGSTSVNHVYLNSISIPEEKYINPVAKPGDSAELAIIIPATSLEEYNISSVDAISFSIQAMSTELQDAYRSGKTDSAEQLYETDYVTETYTFSPTGMDYEEVAPPDVFTEDKYYIIADNDVLTMGVRKNEDGTVINEDGIFFDYVVHTDKTEDLFMYIHDITVDGNPLYSVDGDGEISDIPLGTNFSTKSNMLFTQYHLIDKNNLDGNKIEEPETIQFLIQIKSAEDSSELYNETLTYSFK